MISYAGKSRETVNFLKVVYFDYPEWVPSDVSILPATWMKHREDLEELVLSHPRLFPGYVKGAKDFDEISGPLYELGDHTDCWGSVWRNIERGLDSMVVEEPLRDWSAFEAWQAPDPLESDMFGPRRPWDDVAREFKEAKGRGEFREGWGLAHGFFFMRLFFLRGFENLMMDMAADDERLYELIKIVERYNATVISKLLELGAEWFSCGEDLGNQDRLPVSPAMWRKFIKPSYEVMFGRCRDRGVGVYLHSDGHILEIIPDLIDVGITMLNPQIGANGIAGLRECASGKLALKVDLDRQIFPFATPSQLDDHVGEVFDGLYSERGGLALVAEMGPDVPLENIDAVCVALERLCGPPQV